MDLEKEIELRKDAKFFPKTLIRGEYYDCVTFSLDMYIGLGLLPEDSTFPAYNVYTRGTKMLEMIIEWVEASGAFTEVDEPTRGCLVIATRGLRGHHTGIFLGNDRIVHCCKFRNVEIQDYSTGVFPDHLNKIYKPNGME